MATPYDENLLATAPKATKAQLQDGYNPDILVEKTSSTPTTPAIDPEVAAHLTPVQRQSEDALPLTKKKVPFYATKKGIIFIVVVVVVIIAAVVGGAVGGTRKKQTSADSGQQGGGTAPPSNSTTSTASTGNGMQSFGSASPSTNSNPSTTPTPPSTATQGIGTTNG